MPARFNANITKAAFRFISDKGDEQIDIAAIGRKGRDLFRRRYGIAEFVDKQDEDKPRGGGTRRPSSGRSSPAPEEKRRGERKRPD